jgi:predicted 2-oxoglutarate/Fe(II)-dependent dioxygenase YbiX
VLASETATAGGPLAAVPPELLARFGLFVEPQFLGSTECARICREMATGKTTSATVHEADGRFVVDVAVRSTRTVSVSGDSVELIGRRLAALRPRVERQFGITLQKVQRIQFLAYGAGDHYVAHADNSTELRAAASLRERKISVVIFLNDRAAAPGPGVYGGGALTVWGLFADPRLHGRGVPIAGAPGLLVAFPSHLTHAVETVTHGVRHTVVTWFA